VRRLLCALALLTTLAAPAVRAAGPPPAIVFGTPVNLPGADRFRAVVVADATGDGKNDVVLAGWQDAQVVVHAGDGEGLFDAARVVQTTYAGFERMIAADLNADGAADLVLAQAGLDGVEVVLSDGNGGWTATAYPSGDGVADETEAPAFVDWDGDGDRDVLTVSWQTTRVRLNDGAGGLSAPQPTPFARGFDVLVADLDGDGREDVLVDDFTTGTDKAYWRAPDGSFSAAQDVATTFGSIGRWPQAADLDLDGRADLVGNMRLRNGHPAAFAGVSRQVSARTFAPTWYQLASPSLFAARPSGLALVDLNGDAYPDAVTSRGVLLNQGDGTFGPDQFASASAWPPVHLSLPAPLPWSVAAGDLDGDGVPEIVAAYGADVGGTIAAIVVPVVHKATFIGLASITPSTLYRGSTVDATIAGTGFKAGDVADFGTGIVVNSLTVSSATSLVANVTVLPTAAQGARSVKVSHPDGGRGKLWYAVTVADSGAATVGGLSPDHGHAGDTLDVDVLGHGFVAGAPTAASLGAGVAVNSTSVVLGSRARMNITIAPGAALGLRDLTWTNGTGVQWTATNAFNVLRRRSLDLSLVAARITTKKKPGRGAFTVAGGLAFNQASADGLFDPTKEAVRARFGDPAAPSVVDVPAGAKWRVRGGRFTWKTEKKAKGPRVALTIDLDRHSFSLSVAGMDVATDAFGRIVVDLELGADYGITTRKLAPRRRRTLVLE
jgi:hypothetical protein